MQKLLEYRTADIEETALNYKNIKEVCNKFDTGAEPKQERIHLENINANNRIPRESSVHNEVTHHCNRLRHNGYKDKTWEHRINNEYIKEFQKRRSLDRDRKQNQVNNRFPSLSEARDQYLVQQNYENNKYQNYEKKDQTSFDGSKKIGQSTSTITKEGIQILDEQFMKLQVDPFMDPSQMTKAQKSQLYQKNQSPKFKATQNLKDLSNYVDINVQKQNSRTIQYQDSIVHSSDDNGSERKQNKLQKNKSKQNFTIPLPMPPLASQTLVSTLKHRSIIKNNFQMPRVQNPKFIPVNKSEAKAKIFGVFNHEPEVGTETFDRYMASTLLVMPSNITYSAGTAENNFYLDSDRKLFSNHNSNKKDEFQFSKEEQKLLNNSNFASRLNNLNSSVPLKGSKLNSNLGSILEQNLSNEFPQQINYQKMMYANTSIGTRHKKESVYDYQKIQSTAHQSQFLGQRHFLLGGPSSGNQRSLIEKLHNTENFKRSSPSPSKTFDNVRGAAPEINSYNNLVQFMPGEKERPRLTVLQNFKDISRVLTQNFLKNRENNSSQQRHASDIKPDNKLETSITNDITNIMKRMQSPRSFNTSLQKFGENQKFQDVNLARKIMLESSKISSSIKNGSQALAIGEQSFRKLKQMNMNSVTHNSSQFDKGNLSTIDCTSASIQQAFDLITEIDPIEQKHNSMNLAMGKPTQQLKNSKKYNRAGASEALKGFARSFQKNALEVHQRGKRAQHTSEHNSVSVLNDNLVQGRGTSHTLATQNMNTVEHNRDSIISSDKSKQ